MSFYDAFKDVMNIAQKSDNIDLYKKILDLSAQALELQEENTRLRNENDELRNNQILEEKIVRYDQPYITVNGDDNKTLYCSRCWDVDRRLVQIRCMDNGHFSCPNCNNQGIYNEALRNQKSWFGGTVI